MKTETLRKIFTFLEENGEHNAPLMWKLQNNIPITEKDDLIVKGGLSLWDTDITSLPKGLEVRSNLVVAYSKLTSLPEGLKVGDSLNMFDTKIKSLPEGLVVNRDLYLRGSEIQSLPKGLKVGGFIDLRDTKLTEYTDDDLRKMIEPDGYIRGKIVR